MSDMKGSCLCTAVRVKFDLSKRVFDVCHCGMCRKWGGGPAFCVTADKGPVWSGEEHIQVYDSSEWAQRGFCKNCGTHLFYRLKQGGFTNIPLGLLERADDLHFHLQVYIDHKPTNYDFSNQTAVMTEAEVVAKFSP